MPEILQYGFMQRALLAGAMIGTIAPVIGVFLVLRRLSLIADTPAPGAPPGGAVGLLQGPPVEGLTLLLTILVAVTVVVAMRIVGILLTSALIVIPAVTALRLARNFRSALWMAVACSLVTVLAGITASFYLDIPASGAIVLGGIQSALRKLR